MRDQQTRAYLERRAEQERAAARHAASERSARPHREMADRYEKLVNEESARELPADPHAGILSSDFRLIP